jgi:hypothetical protein
MSERTMQRVGWVMSALFALFILAASAMPKLAGMTVASDVMTRLGWPAGYLTMIGVMEVAVTLMFLWPRTAVLGGILFMGLLGGALASNLRADQPLFSTTLFSIYLGAWMWVALWLRDPAFRAVFPLRTARG